SLHVTEPDMLLRAAAIDEATCDVLAHAMESSRKRDNINQPPQQKPRAPDQAAENGSKRRCTCWRRCLGTRRTCGLGRQPDSRNVPLCQRSPPSTLGLPPGPTAHSTSRGSPALHRPPLSVTVKVVELLQSMRSPPLEPICDPCNLAAAMPQV